MVSFNGSYVGEEFADNIRPLIRAEVQRLKDEGLEGLQLGVILASTIVAPAIGILASAMDRERPTPDEVKRVYDDFIESIAKMPRRTDEGRRVDENR